jgi:uncharacterized membrane-anchored protein YhcB (DUF1043 family)
MEVKNMILGLIGLVLGIGIGIILPIIKKHLKPIKKVELSEEEKAKQKELRKNFDELMNYDYQTALRGDK